MEIVWSRASDRDLAKIYDYLESRSYSSARRFVRRIFKALDLLVEMPLMGKVSEHKTDQEYREIVVDHCKIFYYVEEGAIVIGRLWDTRQDPTRFFLPRSP